jgi:hypothetical protein
LGVEADTEMTENHWVVRPNKRVSYVDAMTGALLGTDDFVDPELGWRFDDRKRSWYLRTIYGGAILPWWIEANPRPTRAP